MEATREFVVIIDSDGQHDPSDIPKLLEYVGAYDMVVGSRVNRGSLSKVRNLGNFFLKHLAQYLTKQKIGDLTSGFRAFSRASVLPFLPLFPARFSSSTTLTLCMIKSSMSIKYVELETIIRRRQGKSSIKPLFDGLRFINIMIRVIMLYSPMTIFLPLGVAGFTVSVALTIYKLAYFHRFTPNIGIFYVVSIFTILLSLIAEQIANMRFELVELSKERYIHNKQVGQ
jgi:glycosyltransferase involved in cell wall biosynthesis